MGSPAQDSLILRSKLILPMLLWFLSLVTSENANTEEVTLLAIRDKWGANVPTWTLRTDKCKGWEGVNCNEEGQVVKLNLTNKGLKGPVPAEIGGLKFLASLDLSSKSDLKQFPGTPNAVLGDLSALRSLKNLQSLNVSRNILVSRFPAAVLDLTELVELILSGIYMTGQFPKEIGKLEKLQILNLGNNSMTGPLPHELGNLIQLRELSLWNNIFDSEIPPELGNLQNLTSLNMHNCTLWGGLPLEFAKLCKMKTLLLYENSFTGRIPDSWKEMKNLEKLWLQDNFLTGNDFPSWTLEHPTLKSLALSYNKLHSKLPNISNTKFILLRLECNYFTGPQPPTSIGRTELDTHGNCYTGVNPEDKKSKKSCSDNVSCAEFNETLNAYGCPPCPRGQDFSNRKACICTVHQKGLYIVAKVLGSIAVVVVIVLAIVGFLLYHRENARAQTLSRFNTFISKGDASKPWDVPKELHRFMYQELSKATSNFSKSNQIGMGGFGKVYLGTLPSGKRVAIKRASLLSMQGASEFRNEVLLLSRLHHRNLVRLEGFCEDDGLQFLVYEYIPTGNLQSWLSEIKARSSLSWSKRMEIALGIAQGLNYLHSFADPPVIHRDVKPSNILLDYNLVPKVADFGISKAALESETHISTNPAGTAGYIDPQYFLRGQLTTASDVFGFGVVLLDLITGQKAIDQTRTDANNLVEWVKRKVMVEGIKSIIDPFLCNTHPDSVFMELTQLAIKCAAFERENRPSMKEIITALEMHLQDLPPPPPSTSQSLSGPSKGLVEMRDWDSQVEYLESTTALFPR